jgi:MFS family permease
MKPTLPNGAGYGIAFAVCNVFPVTIALGAPMLLYFKQLGASATILGIVAALPHLFTLLQMPASSYVDRYGYRTFVLSGWSIRTIFLFGVALIPLLPASVTAESRMALLLLALVLFNISRGLSMCGWLPWITQWIPESVRGAYLAREQFLCTFATVAVMLLAAALLGPSAGPSAYALLFLVSAIGGVASLFFLRRIPDVPAPPEARNTRRPPWLAILRHPPFRQLLTYDVFILAACAGAGVFWIPLLRDYHAATDRFILGMLILSSLLTAGWLLLFSRMIDRVGSRPLLALSGMSHAIHFASWSALSAGVIPLNVLTVFVLQGTAALAWSLYSVARLRLLMAIVPQAGRSHFLALFTSITALISGILPIAWGVLLDALELWRVRWFAWEWNSYSAVYAMCFALVIAAQYWRTLLPEPKAMPMDQFLRELFSRAPAWVQRAFKQQMTTDY